ncbi:helix-turn-helix transcriptional regulator [Chloroflexota bacterium]
MTTEKLTISIDEAAKLLGISRNLAYNLAREGKLPGALELGQKRIRVSRVALEKYLNGE